MVYQITQSKCDLPTIVGLERSGIDSQGDLKVEPECKSVRKLSMLFSSASVFS